MAKAKAVDTIKSEFAVLDMEQEELQEIFDVNLQGENLSQGDLERIVMPSGKTRAWTIPGIEGDEHLENFTGIIVAWKKARAYWKDKYSGAGEPPDCRSDDGQIGQGTPGGLCRDCPLSMWQDDEQPLCTDQRILFILFPDNILPYMMVVPPTSIVPLRRYLLGLFNRRVKHYGVKTKFFLNPATNPNGMDYSKIGLEIEDTLTPEETMKLAVYNENIRQLIAFTSSSPDLKDIQDPPIAAPLDNIDIPEDENLVFENELTFEDAITTDEPPLTKTEAEDELFEPMDKFLKEKKAEWSYFWVTTRTLGKTPDEVHEYFGVDSLTKVKKKDLDVYLNQLYANVKGSPRW